MKLVWSVFTVIMVGFGAISLVICEMGYMHFAAVLSGAIGAFVAWRNRQMDTSDEQAKAFVLELKSKVDGVDASKLNAAIDASHERRFLQGVLMAAIAGIYPSLMELLRNQFCPAATSLCSTATANQNLVVLV